MNIIKTNGKYFFFSTADFMKKLEPGNYSLNFDAKGNLYLEDEDPFRLPAKVYDVDKAMVDQIIRTYKEGGEKNLGILLQGMKGQGKSLTAIIYEINERTESVEGAKGPKTRLAEYKLVKKDVYPFTAPKITTNIM